MLKSIKRHYHWLVAVLVFWEMVVFGGLINSASVFIRPISESLRVATTSYAVALMPYTVSCFVCTSMSGFFFGRFGYKKTTFCALIIIIGSLVLTAFSQNLMMFCISKILFGIGYGACFTAGSVRIVRDWFWKRQGLVLGAVSMATGLGGSLLTILLTNTIQKSGWRMANILASALVACIALLYLLLMKDRPEQLGLQPYGQGKPLQAVKKQQYYDGPDMTLKDHLRHPKFYIMCACVLCSCICIYTTTSFISPHFQSQGYTPERAATFQSVHMLALAIIKLTVGFLHDKFGVKPVMIGCMLCAIISQLTLGMTNNSTLSMIAVIILSGGLCMTSIMIPLIAAPLFGHKACLQLNGIFLGMSSFAALFSNTISSMCYDRFGVYSPVYRIAPFVNLGILCVYLLLFAAVKKKSDSSSLRSSE